MRNKLIFTLIFYIVSIFFYKKSLKDFSTSLDVFYSHTA